MKKKKVSLEALSVKSFVVVKEPKQINTVKAGGTHYEHCSFDPCGLTIISEDAIA